MVGGLNEQAEAGIGVEGEISQWAVGTVPIRLQLIPVMPVMVRSLPRRARRLYRVFLVLVGEVGAGGGLPIPPFTPIIIAYRLAAKGPIDEVAKGGGYGAVRSEKDPPRGRG